MFAAQVCDMGIHSLFARANGKQNQWGIHTGLHGLCPGVSFVKMNTTHKRTPVAQPSSSQRGMLAIQMITQVKMVWLCGGSSRV